MSSYLLVSCTGCDVFLPTALTEVAKLLEVKGRFEITTSDSGAGFSISVPGPSSWYVDRLRSGGCLKELKIKQGTFAFFCHQLRYDIEGD
jgi:hypothetical protein